MPIEPVGRFRARGRGRSVRRVTQEFAGISPALRSSTPSNLARLFRRVGGIVAAVVGLVFLLVGVTLAVSQSWAPATGTVQSCRSHTIHSGSSNSKRVDQICNVTWHDAAGDHAASVDFGSTAVYNGQSAAIRVRGNDAVLRTPAWEGYVAMALGVALIAVGALVSVRAWRRVR
jgi:hypothetical protein